MTTQRSYAPAADQLAENLDWLHALRLELPNAIWQDVERRVRALAKRTEQAERQKEAAIEFGADMEADRNLAVFTKEATLELLAEAEAAREQAEERLRQYEEPGWINTVQKAQELKAQLAQAEKERDEARVGLTHQRTMKLEAQAERDRLAAALKRMIETAGTGEMWEAMREGRKALAQTTQEGGSDAEAGSVQGQGR